MLVDRQRRPDPAALRHIAEAAPDDLIQREADDVLARDTDAALVAGTRPMIVLQSVVLPVPLRPTTESTPCSSVRQGALQRVGAAVMDVQITPRPDRLSPRARSAMVRPR